MENKPKKSEVLTTTCAFRLEKNCKYSVMRWYQKKFVYVGSTISSTMCYLLYAKQSSTRKPIVLLVPPNTTQKALTKHLGRSDISTKLGYNNKTWCKGDCDDKHYGTVGVPAYWNPSNNPWNSVSGFRIIKRRITAGKDYCQVDRNTQGNLRVRGRYNWPNNWTLSKWRTFDIKEINSVLLYIWQINCANSCRLEVPRWSNG